MKPSISSSPNHSSALLNQSVTLPTKKATIAIRRVGAGGSSSGSPQLKDSVFLNHDDSTAFNKDNNSAPGRHDNHIQAHFIVRSNGMGRSTMTRRLAVYLFCFAIPIIFLGQRFRRIMLRQGFQTTTTMQEPTNETTSSIHKQLNSWKIPVRHPHQINPTKDKKHIHYNNNKNNTTTHRNAPWIQSILESKSSLPLWRPYRNLQWNKNKDNESMKVKVDITQNLGRMEDYLNDDASTTKSDVAKDSTQQRRQRRQLPRPSRQKNAPLNIVLFYADDWTMNVLGALNPHVQTPNIDGMAERGILFTRNCVTTSICWISRNTLATGVYAAIHQTVELTSLAMFNRTVPWLQTLYPMLKQHGYYTGLVGKWHALKPKEYISQAFHHIRNYYNKHWFVRDGKRRHVTELNQHDAIEFLQTRPKDQRFALTVSFFATHAWEGVDPPYQPMNESMNLYVNQTIPKPRTATDQHWKHLPWFFTERNMGRQRWMDRFDTDDNYQDKIKNLYRMATEVDAAVGAIVEELKVQGVYEDTLMVFTTDNGNMHGEHGLAEKWYPFEESIRVPLVIQDPRMPMERQGTRNDDDFTLSVDLAPTILSAAHIPIPSFMQGRDIAQLYLNNDNNTKHDNREMGLASSDWRQDFFYEWNQGNPVNARGHAAISRNVPAVFALIRKDYKYFYWPETRYEQLFRIENDPYEESDLRNSTAQTTQMTLQLIKARYQFLKRWAQTGNPV